MLHHNPKGPRTQIIGFLVLEYSSMHGIWALKGLLEDYGFAGKRPLSHKLDEEWAIMGRSMAVSVMDCSYATGKSSFNLGAPPRKPSNQYVARILYKTSNL